MFCDRPLGTNDVLESFPVGRRLAFDAVRGRLWAVCRRCERWNLAPLEERWEAVEACERLFAGIRLRVSTDNVGLARHSEGLELVRIGRPLRPEFAAWRYGDQFGRRRKRAIAYGVAGAAVVGAVAIAGTVTGVVSGAFVAQSGNLYNLWRNARTVVRVRTPDGRLLDLKYPHIEKARVLTGEDGWSVTVKKGGAVEAFRGDEAERVAGLLMTRINHAGGRRETVQQAVREIETLGHPEAFVEDAVRRLSRGELGGPEGRLAKMPAPSRLALEMALHEEREHRALEGELKGLEIVWRREEEIAAIADDLLLPGATRDRLDALRNGAAGAEVPVEGRPPSSE